MFVFAVAGLTNSLYTTLGRQSQEARDDAYTTVCPKYAELTREDDEYTSVTERTVVDEENRYTVVRRDGKAQSTDQEHGATNTRTENLYNVS